MRRGGLCVYRALSAHSSVLRSRAGIWLMRSRGVAGTCEVGIALALGVSNTLSRPKHGFESRWGHHLGLVPCRRISRHQLTRTFFTSGHSLPRSRANSAWVLPSSPPLVLEITLIRHPHLLADRAILRLPRHVRFPG